MAIDDPRDVAAGAPVVASLPGENRGSLQVQSLVFTGKGSIADGGLLALDDLSFQFDQATNGFILNPAVAGWTATLPYDPATESAGKTFELAGPNGERVELKLSGVPADNDIVKLADNTGGIADNRNAALLGALQTDKLMFGAGADDATPTATLNNAYAQLVAKIGSKTREVQAGERTQNSLLAQATSARDSVSGVNLDEEAANLVRFQQTYQAAGRVMSVAQRLFDEMLAIGR